MSGERRVRGRSGKMSWWKCPDTVPEWHKRNLVTLFAVRSQNTCETYNRPIRVEHRNVDCFYLANTYFKLPRQNIRENVNFVCLFPQDLKNINHRLIYNDHASTGMPRGDFLKLCETAYRRPYGCIVIDQTRKWNTGKYRNEIVHSTFYT